MVNNPLFDIEFLTELSKNRYKETFARITALNWEEQPLEFIEGQVTAGTVNIDGSSAVRRTCSLSLLATDININNFYWGLNTKFKLEIGLVNNINSNYNDIIWFPQGIFIITSFNTSISTNNYTISISGKDKMCMLNGDLGGNLYASIDFGVEEYWDKINNITYYNKIPIKTIIRNAVNIYGNELLHNIIITDIDNYGVELLKYRGDTSTPLYLFKDHGTEQQEIDSSLYVNMSLNQNQNCWVEISEDNWKKTTISAIDKVGGAYDERINTEHVVKGSRVKLKNTDDATVYRVHKITHDNTVGYRLTDITYAGDLISKAGDSLTSILDKIKTMLGDFEYFYDVYGRFIFQKKKTYITNDWNSQVKREDDMYVESAAYTTSSVYTFNDSHYFTAISHTPVLNNLKNDFIAWGNRKSVTGVDLPIHMRLAIDKKPYSYTTISISAEESEMLINEYGFSYTPSEQALEDPIILKSEKQNKYKQNSRTYTTDDVDWRELIYIMAIDYFKYNAYDYFQMKVAEANREKGHFEEDLYPIGYTGYEIYYTDLQGFWRELYNPNIFNSVDNQDLKPVWGVQYYTKNEEKNQYEPIKFESAVSLLTPTEKEYWKLEQGKYIRYIKDDNFQFKYGEEYYLYDEKKDEYKLVNIYAFLTDNKYYWPEDPECDINTSWNYNVTKNPEVLNFWFDFIGEGSSLDKYMVCNIGDRTKVVNDNKITGIYFKETPAVLFVTNDEYVAMAGKPMKTGYTYIRINDSLSNFFSISAQGKSAQDVIETLLYENTYCMENVSLTSIPIYHLDANTRIEIHDKESGIDGEYLISKLTLPLTYNGTMSITASKAVDTIY